MELRVGMKFRVGVNLVMVNLERGWSLVRG